MYAVGILASVSWSSERVRYGFKGLERRSSCEKNVTERMVVD